MFDEVSEVGFREVIKRFAAGVPEIFDRPLFGRSEQSFEFRKRQFDWIEIGTVGWQKSHRSVGGLDRMGDAFDLVAAEVVHDDNIARPQLLDQVLLNPSQEHRSVDRTVDHQRSNPATGSNPSQERRGFPAPVRDVFYQPSTFE